MFVCTIVVVNRGAEANSVLKEQPALFVSGWRRSITSVLKAVPVVASSGQAMASNELFGKARRTGCMCAE
jgi:hypothetical protein